MLAAAHGDETFTISLNPTIDVSARGNLKFCGAKEKKVTLEHGVKAKKTMSQNLISTILSLVPVFVRADDVETTKFRVLIFVQLVWLVLTLIPTLRLSGIC